jgi:hypothetical protein
MSTATCRNRNRESARSDNGCRSEFYKARWNAENASKTGTGSILFGTFHVELRTLKNGGLGNPIFMRC